MRLLKYCRILKIRKKNYFASPNGVEIVLSQIMWSLAGLNTKYCQSINTLN